MTELVRIRLAIVVLAAGAIVFWAWGDLTRAVGDAFFEPAGGLSAARA